MLVGDYTLTKSLGKGAFGEVYITSKQGTQEKFATKKIDKKFARNPKAKKYIDNEIKILKSIDHENIIKLYDQLETSQYYFLVTEYCNGGGLSDCLEYHINQYHKPFSEEVVQYLMRQIVSGIRYLHSKHILHRDIKLDNILVKFDTEEDKQKKNMLKAKVKIIDFGFARYLDPKELAFSTLGSPINMEPGILRKLNKMENSRNYGYDEKADIWSLGTICYEMLIGHCTFDASSMKELLSKVEAGNYLLPTSISKEAASFLNGMLQYDPKQRLNAEKLYTHHFLTKDYKSLTKMNLNNVQKHLYGANLKINSKKNQNSIWVIFEEEESLDSISGGDMISTEDNDKSKVDDENPKPIIEPIKTVNEYQMDEKSIMREFQNAFDEMNDDFIFIEPKLIPIIPGDDPAVISKISQFNEDYF
jgi:serine/threonine protein kinase